MRIVADENIPLAKEAFCALGDVRLIASEDLSPAALKDADAVVVRSVTKVGEALLGDSPVKLVASATTGLDHIDRGWLAGRGIALVDGAGANANAVAEYVIAALLHLQQRAGGTLAGSTIGIVGLGTIGRLVARYTALLGMRCVVNDPPLGRSSAEPLYRPLEDIFACDFVTLHVPLERAGTDPTYHLVDVAFLEGMRTDSVLINSSRGAVVDKSALKQALLTKQIGGCVLDVWEDEPLPDPALAEACALSTPHIAGFTREAKRGLTLRAAEAACRQLGVTFSTPDEDVDGAGKIELAGTDSDAVNTAVLNAFDIQGLDSAFRASLALPQRERAATFQAMRSGAPTRREFTSYVVESDGQSERVRDVLLGLGFSVGRARTMAANINGDNS